MKCAPCLQTQNQALARSNRPCARILGAQRGTTLLEYITVLSLIFPVCVMGISEVGEKSDATFEMAGQALELSDSSFAAMMFSGGQGPETTMGGSGGCSDCMQQIGGGGEETGNPSEPGNSNPEGEIEEAPAELQ